MLESENKPHLENSSVHCVLSCPVVTQSCRANSENLSGILEGFYISYIFSFYYLLLIYSLM